MVYLLMNNLEEVIMEIFGINVIAVVSATVTGMVLGALWYSPMLFGNQWMKCLGKTPETLGSATAPMIGSVIASLMTAIGVAFLSHYIGVNSINMALHTGFILAFLIIFPAFLSDSLFCGWGTKLLLIQAGYRMVSVVLMSIVVYLL